MSGEQLSAMSLLGLGLLVTVAYLVRVYLKGQAHFERVDQQGSSVFLGKSIMELGYWFFQPFARFLAARHITPNQISWASLSLGFLAGLSLAFGHFGSGAVFAALSGIMDSLDGLVARMTHQSSGAGEILDATVDRYTEFFFLGGLAFYYRQIPSLLLLSLVAWMGAYMVSYSTAKAEAMHLKPPRGIMRRPERAFYLTLGAALSPLSVPWLEPWLEMNRIPWIAFGSSGSGTQMIGYPMVLAVGLVAMAANFSAIERLRKIAKTVRGATD
jgi:phosphatidylglycerophosphate synthase